MEDVENGGLDSVASEASGAFVFSSSVLSAGRFCSHR